METTTYNTVTLARTRTGDMTHVGSTGMARTNCGVRIASTFTPDAATIDRLEARGTLCDRCCHPERLIAYMRATA